MCPGTPHFMGLFYPRAVMLIFFYYLDFEMIEFDIFYETVFGESCFGMSFEILDILIEPYGLGQIESKAYFLQ